MRTEYPMNMKRPISFFLHPWAQKLVDQTRRMSKKKTRHKEILKYETNNQNIVKSSLSENGEAWNEITITKPKPTHKRCKVIT